MNYDNALLSEIEKIYLEKRKKAEQPVEILKQALFSNSDYLSAYNGYNATRFEISKAKFMGDDDNLPVLKAKLNDYKLKMQEIRLSLGYDDKTLSPKYECKSCLDTGRTADGVRCKCFKKLVCKLTLEKLGLEKKKLPSFFSERNNVF